MDDKQSPGDDKRPGDEANEAPANRQGATAKKRRREPSWYSLSSFDAAITREIIKANVEVTADGCWLWQGPLNRGDYGVFLGRPVHRLSYMAFVGPIPEKYHIDHVCRVRHCCRAVPMDDGSLHLEPVTLEENNRRAMAYVQKYPGERVHQAAKRWCKYGHPFDEENTGIDGKGKRYCKQCRKDHLKKWRREVEGQTPVGRQWRIDKSRFEAIAADYPRVLGEPVLNTVEAAGLFGIHVHTLRDWTSRYRDDFDIPRTKSGKRLAWPQSLILHLLAAWTDEPWSRQRIGDKPIKVEKPRVRRRTQGATTDDTKSSTENG